MNKALRTGYLDEHLNEGQGNATNNLPPEAKPEGGGVGEGVSQITVVNACDGFFGVFFFPSCFQ